MVVVCVMLNNPSKEILLLYRKGNYTTTAISYNDKYQGIDLIGEAICIDTAMTH